MQIDQDTLIAIREFLPSTNEPPLMLYLAIGLFIGAVVVIIKYERYRKIRELFMKLF